MDLRKKNFWVVSVNYWSYTQYFTDQAYVMLFTVEECRLNVAGYQLYDKFIIKACLCAKALIWTQVKVWWHFVPGVKVPHTDLLFLKVPQSKSSMYMYQPCFILLLFQLLKPRPLGIDWKQHTSVQILTHWIKTNYSSNTKKRFCLQNHIC